MRKASYTLLIIVCLIVACLPGWAASRTTPVEVMNTPVVAIDPNNSTVKAVQMDPWYMNILGTPNFNIVNSPTVKIDGTTNTVKIDATTNTVKAAQSGTWSVGISGTPSVAQSGTWNVGITGTPSVSVSNTPSVNIANAPSVSVSNSPTVKIDATTNAVDTPTKHNTIQLWATDTPVPNNSSVAAPSFSTAGYREMRVVLWPSGSGAGLTAYVSFRTPTGNFVSVKVVPWPGGTINAFTCEVYGDTCQVMVGNNLGFSINILSHSYVYLVN